MHLGGFEESAVSSRADRFGGGSPAGERVKHRMCAGIRGPRREQTELPQGRRPGVRGAHTERTSESVFIRRGQKKRSPRKKSQRGRELS